MRDELYYLSLVIVENASLFIEMIHVFNFYAKFLKKWHLRYHFFSQAKLDLFHNFGPHSRSYVIAFCGAILDVKSNCFLIQHI